MFKGVLTPLSVLTGIATLLVGVQPQAAAQCEQAKLTASDAAGAQFFGSSVSVSGDYAVIVRQGGGATYVFHREGNQWLEQARMVGVGGMAGISGNRFVLGNASDDEGATDAGAVRVFRREGTIWVEETKLIASDPMPGDALGRSVGIDGDVIVAGAPGVDDAALDGGAVYVFQWDGTSWIEEQKLTALDAQASDELGRSVSLSRDVLIAAAPQIHPLFAPGKAYIFRRIGSTWTQEQQVTVPTVESYEFFANDVAISGDVAAVGVPAMWGDEDPPRPGSVYVFTYDGSAWVEEAKLQASDFKCCGDFFGTSVALSDGVLAVGAPQGPDGGMAAFTGTAYVFHRVGATWIEHAKLSRADAEPADFFGETIAVGAAHALVGAGKDDDACPEDVSCESGSVYVFSLEECGVFPIPATSTWGVVTLALLIITAGPIIIRLRRRARRLGMPGECTPSAMC